MLWVVTQINFTYALGNTGSLYKKHGNCFIYEPNQKRSFLHKSCNLKLVHMEPSIFMTWIMVALKVNIRRNGSSILLFPLLFPFLLTYLNWWFHKVKWLNFDAIKYYLCFIFQFYEFIANLVCDVLMQILRNYIETKWFLLICICFT